MIELANRTWHTSLLEYHQDLTILTGFSRKLQQLANCMTDVPLKPRIGDNR